MSPPSTLSSLASRIRRALANGRVTPTEAKNIVAEVTRDKKVTTGERQQLLALVGNHFQKLAPGARDRLTKFLYGNAPKDPAVPVRPEQRDVHPVRPPKPKPVPPAKRRVVKPKPPVERPEVLPTPVIPPPEFNHRVRPEDELVPPVADYTAFGEVVDPRRNLADPAIRERDALEVQFAWADGGLFKAGPSADDVMQGQIGDCFFLSALAGVAAMQPELIPNAIKDNGDGTYDIKLFQPSELWGTDREPVTVTVDGQLPQHHLTGLVYGRGRDKEELWVGLMEKAFAQLRGAYEAIANGGNMGEALATLTGKNYTDVPLAPSVKPDDVYSAITRTLDAKKPVLISTPNTEGLNKRRDDGLVSGHAYTVLGVEQQNGERVLVLRNPWGSTEPVGDAINDGIFRIQLKDVLKDFDHMVLGG